MYRNFRALDIDMQQVDRTQVSRQRIQRDRLYLDARCLVESRESRRLGSAEEPRAPIKGGQSRDLELREAILLRRRRVHEAQARVGNIVVGDMLAKILEVLGLGFHADEQQLAVRIPPAPRHARTHQPGPIASAELDHAEPVSGPGQRFEQRLPLESQTVRLLERLAAEVAEIRPERAPRPNPQCIDPMLRTRRRPRRGREIGQRTPDAAVEFLRRRQHGRHAGPKLGALDKPAQERRPVGDRQVRRNHLLVLRLPAEQQAIRGHDVLTSRLVAFVIHQRRYHSP